MEKQVSIDVNWWYLAVRISTNIYFIQYFIVYEEQNIKYAAVLVNPLEEKQSIHNEYLNYKMMKIDPTNILFSVSEICESTTLREACSIYCKLNNDFKVECHHNEVEGMYSLDEWHQ